MMDAPVRFLADMNISPQTVDALLSEGMDIVRVSSLLPANASDQSILGLAREQGRAVITQDMDFSALLALSGHDQPSLVTLRLLNTNPEVVSQRLRQVLPQTEAALRAGCAVTIEDHTVRVRQLPIQ